MTRDYPVAGSRVDALDVGDEIPNIESIAATLDDYEVLPGIREVPLADFNSAPHDLFYARDDIERAAELAREIEKGGWIAPLIVVVDDEGPYILEGAHRLAALHLLGQRFFPALVVMED